MKDKKELSKIARIGLILLAVIVLGIWFFVFVLRPVLGI
jgi:hypothetical protein